MTTDVFVYSYARTANNDVIKDFEVGTDKIYLVDVNDAYTGSGNWAASGDAAHRSRFLGDPTATSATGGAGYGSTVNTNMTMQSDNNLTIRDFVYANDAGTTSTATGQNKQYITLTGDANGDLVIHLNGPGTGTSNDAFGSITLTGVKYEATAVANDGKYGSVAELFGIGETRLIWATTDGFKEPVTSTTFSGQTVQYFDWQLLTNITNNANIIV